MSEVEQQPEWRDVSALRAQWSATDDLMGMEQVGLRLLDACPLYAAPVTTDELRSWAERLNDLPEPLPDASRSQVVAVIYAIYAVLGEVTLDGEDPDGGGLDV